jgi:hypothetical protein
MPVTNANLLQGIVIRHEHFLKLVVGLTQTFAGNPHPHLIIHEIS